jgi:hypothetical protein
MMRPRAIKITAIALALGVFLSGFAGWDILFDRFVTAEWPPHTIFF